MLRQVAFRVVEVLAGRVPVGDTIGGAPVHDREKYVQPVVRALALLRAISADARGVSLAELSAQLDIPLASTHRVLNVLETESFVTRSTTNRRYFIGQAARDLAMPAIACQSPLVRAHPAVLEASRRTGETVFLTSMAGTQAVCMALHESRSPLRLFVHVGQVMPWHAAASARVLLAWQDRAVVQQLLGAGPFPTFTARTPSTLQAVEEHLRRIRTDGYDVCDAELDEGVWAVAAPVRNSTQDVIASVTAAAPTLRVFSTPNARELLVRVIQDSAQEMSSDLGWQPERLD